MDTPFTSRAAGLLAQVEEQMNQRIAELQALMPLRADPGKEATKRAAHTLAAASSEMSEVEAVLSALDSYCRAERETLSRAEVLLAMAHRQASRLDALERVVPQPAPAPAAQAAESCGSPGNKENQGTNHTSPTRTGGEAAVGAAEKSTPSPAAPKGRRGGKQPAPTIAKLSAKELNRAPQYISGRLTLDKVNEGVAAINDLVQHKYALLARPHRDLSSAELDLVEVYRSLDPGDDARHSFFFSSNDLRQSGALRPPSFAKGVITLLRHCKRLREVSGPKGVRLYVIIT